MSIINAYPEDELSRTGMHRCRSIISKHECKLSENLDSKCSQSPETCSSERASSCSGELPHRDWYDLQ